MKPFRVLSENIYEVAKAKFEKWERIGIKDEKLDEPARIVFWAIGILSWSNLELHKYVNAAGEMLKAMSEIMVVVDGSADEFFRNEVYPVFQLACAAALNHLAELLHDSRNQ